MMQAVRRSGTEPELAVRRALARIGVRHRASSSRLPGTPDVVNLRRSWAIFVHGCFWHGHRNCLKTKGGAGGRIPVSNRSFWTSKIAANRERDSRKGSELRRRGFRVLTIWECQSRDSARLEKILIRFFTEITGPEPPRKGTSE
ncbi:MAG: DNA mismatch endonuclease Vsr [Acidobacteriia bacterium]|nr:DNA mismatch endonuclease Vsr [Terriglobia bacterium]